MNIVTTDSKAYGYNYASLGDIAKQGFKIPKMKTGTDNGREYVFWFDEELKEWFRGAEIVDVQMKGSNEAQRYGSALTYARRYTALMSLSLVCDEDTKIEKQKPEEAKEKPKKKLDYDPSKDTGEAPTDDQLKALNVLGQKYGDLVMKCLAVFKVNQTNQLTKDQARASIGWINAVKEN